MKIVVCKLGHVGVAVAACMLRQGATVVGIDVNPQKVEIANGGHSPMKEPWGRRSLCEGSNRKPPDRCDDAGQCARGRGRRVACVGTPSCEDGSLETVVRLFGFGGNWHGRSASIAKMPATAVCIPIDNAAWHHGNGGHA